MEELESLLDEYAHSTGVNMVVIASRSGIPLSIFTPDNSEDIKEALSAAASGIVHISEYVSDLLKFKGVRDIQINIPGDRHIIAVSAGNNALVMAVVEGEGYVSQAITLVIFAQKVERFLKKHPEYLPEGERYISEYDEDLDKEFFIPEVPKQ
jgi:predicted regulator of Ras-like GTPase activity (Roadblock/LC7/MglB family)